MNYLMADIFEYSFEYFPGFVLCKFTDIFGKIHYINEKIPVVSNENIWAYNKSAILPQKAYVAGKIIDKEKDIINFSIIKPWYIETNESVSAFYVHDNQIINEIEYNLIHKIKYIIDNNCNDKDLNLLKKIHTIIMEYKNNRGAQRKAYNAIMTLYKLYNEQNMKEKMDFAACILDMIAGNKEYLIWKKQLKI